MISPTKRGSYHRLGIRCELGDMQWRHRWNKNKKKRKKKEKGKTRKITVYMVLYAFCQFTVFIWIPQLTKVTTKTIPVGVIRWGYGLHYQVVLNANGDWTNLFVNDCQKGKLCLMTSFQKIFLRILLSNWIAINWYSIQNNCLVKFQSQFSLASN